MAQRSPAAVAAGCCLSLLAATAFVLPSTQVAQPPAQLALRGAVEQDLRSSTPLSALVLPVCGLGAIAALALARKQGSAKAAAQPKVVRTAFENEIGVQDPVGFWDPLNLCADGPEAFNRRRCVEIKHGRLSMYACMGYIVPEYFKFPGYLSPSQGLKFADVPNGLAAITKVPVLGWLQILFFGGLIETTGFTFSETKPIGFMKDASMAGEPGNYGLGFIGCWNKIKPIPQLRTRKLNAELANGRLAMVAILAMLFQNGTMGTTGPEMWWFAPTPEYATVVGDFFPKGQL